MKKKQKYPIKDFLYNRYGITISDFLEIYINNPSRIETANYTTLQKLAMEYAPIHKIMGYVLDGPMEITQIVFFDLFLQNRISKKPELLNLFLGESGGAFV